MWLRHCYVLVFLCVEVWAQAILPVVPEEEELVTDRPDFTESANVVRRDWYQLETGFAFNWETHKGQRTKSFTAPFPLLRMGLSKRWELRFSADGYARNNFFNEHGQRLEKGLSDYEIGLKYVALEEKRFLPQVAVIGHVSEPLGSASMTSGSIDPKVKICWAKEAPFGWSVSGNFNYLYLTEDGQRFLERDATISMGHDLVKKFKVYFEFYRLGNVTLDKENLTVAQMGTSRMIGKNVQIDMSVAKTVFGSTPQWSVMGGFTIRAPVMSLLSRRF